MTKIILIRHGQTLWNVEAKYQGHADIALTEQGLSQAQKVAVRLAGETISAVYASDLCRAFKTAECIAEHHQLPVTAIAELREISFGDWEGLSYKTIHDQWPEEMGKLFTHPDEMVIPGGETFQQLKERSQSAIEGLVAKHPDETIVVVSHGGTIRTILCAALDIHLNKVWNIEQGNTAVNVIDYYDDRAIVSLVNDVHHLK